MGSQLKEDCPFCADNARKRREQMDAMNAGGLPEKGTSDFVDRDGSDSKGG
jgi:hypothetical protein